MNQDKQIMGFVAIALAAVVTIYLTSMPPKTTQTSSMPSADEMAALAPAAGEAVVQTIPGSVGTVGEDQSLDKGEAYSVVRIYSTEEECKEATNTACHFVKCEDATAMGVETEEQEKAIENACEATEKTGWRAVVPKPDNTAVPEKIGEPIEINSEAPAP